jgi:hypothetical protein
MAAKSLLSKVQRRLISPAVRSAWRSPSRFSALPRTVPATELLQMAVSMVRPCWEIVRGNPALTDNIFMVAGLDALGSGLVARFGVGEDHAIEAQQFGQRPGLKWTAARRERRFGVGDLRNVAETGVL